MMKHEQEHEHRQRSALAAHTLLHWGSARRARSGVLALLLLLATTLLAVQGTYAQEQAATENAVVNINTADAATLAQQLTGVGLSRAEAIVRYRETYGPFSKAEELTEVKGIGPSTLEQNRARIALE